MDNALALTPQPQDIRPTTLGARVQALPVRSKLAFGVGVAALVGVVFAMTMWGSQADYKVLYANLSDKDGGAVLAQLSQMNVAYRMAESGTAILVPAAKVHDLRLKLATAGLPKGAVSGFELMDSARFGQTQFQERLTFQRGLEGELTRSITSLAAVEAARVHLALPNQNGFFREQQKPSASVLLTLHPGRLLDRAQIAGIVHLVSSSVPELSPKAVSVLDQSGALLTGRSESAHAGLDAEQLQYVSQVEAGYAKRIRELLEPVVGADNLRATVTAAVDFSQTEATSEEFKPNQGADANPAVRSQQTSEQGAGSGNALPSGVPGAASNQPPIAATAPLTGASQPLQGAPSSSAGATGSNGRREAVTNYEVDKTVRVVKNASGVVKRLNAAVVVNNRSVVDARGKSTQVPLGTEELEKLSALVRESIGFDKDRGDSVKVINAPFRVDTFKPVELPWWRQPDVLDIARTLALPVGLAIVAMLVFFGMVRPGVKALLAAPRRLPSPRLDTIEDEAPPLPMPTALEAPQVTARLESARQMAQQNPAAVAGILRGWVGGDAASAAR